jgi:ABC-2 type transport system permease protein
MIIFITAKAGSVPAPPGVRFVTVAMLEASDGMFAGLQNAAGMLGIVALALWAVSASSDYANGLIRLLVQAEPSRLRLLFGKIVALTAFTCVATLVTTLVVLLVSPSIAGLADVSTDAWNTGLLRTAAAGYLHLTLAALLWGVVGLCLGIVTRSSAMAISVGVGYLLVFEGLMGMVMENAAKWLPGSSFAAIASGGTVDVTYATALVLAAGYGIAALAITAVVFRRRDITA